VTDTLAVLQTALADRYTLERELGRGGMATVYLARDLKHGRPVAIKVLRPELAAALGSERFLREIQLTANLQHPHILALYDSGEAAGFLYYVMPLVEGESLRDRLAREKQLPLDEALAIATQVVAVLGYAHQRGIIHRDIKPENILLSAGEAVVADFGIARAVSVAGGEKLTETGLAVGTAAYMSPEQAAGEQDLDGRSDIYALGCVLYEMLTGEQPFTGASAQAILAKRLSEPVPHLRTLRDVPPAIERAVTTALAKSPADRFSSAAAFAAALGSGPTREQASPRRRWIYPSVGAVAVGLVVALALVMLRSRGPRSVSSTQPIAVAVLPFHSLSSSGDLGFLSIGIPDAIITGLANVGRLRLRPTTAVLRYEGKVVDPSEAGRELETEYVVTGTLQAAEERLGVRVQLVRVGDGASLWGDRYDVDRRDLLGLQSKIAEEVVSALRIRLSGAERDRVYARYTRNAAAYESYLQGRSELARGTQDGTLAAINAFERARQLDSGYALAWAGLAMASAEMSLRFAAQGATQQWSERAHAEAARALALDSSVAETHLALAALYRKADFDWDRTIAESNRALTLNPGLELPHYYRAAAFYHLGLLELADSEVSVGLEAGSENRTEGLRTKGVTALLEGRYADATTLFLEVQRLRRQAMADSYLPQAFYYAGEQARAERIVDSLRFSPNIPAGSRHKATLASFLAAGGERRRAQALLDTLTVGGYMDHHVAYSVGVAYAQLGNQTAALAWLRRSAESGFPCYPWFARDPLLAPLRRTPEFTAFLAELRAQTKAAAARYGGPPPG
jgi:serine/threonine-protein kinase